MRFLRFEKWNEQKNSGRDLKIPQYGFFNI